MLLLLCKFVFGLSFFVSVFELALGQEAVNHYSSLDAVKAEERYSVVGASSSTVLNLTGILSKQVKLPCVVERDRKFIWMRSERDEIISIDRTLISNDKRLSLDSTRCQSKLAGRAIRGADQTAKSDC